MRVFFFPQGREMSRGISKAASIVVLHHVRERHKLAPTSPHLLQRTRPWHLHPHAPQPGSRNAQELGKALASLIIHPASSSLPHSAGARKKAPPGYVMKASIPSVVPPLPSSFVVPYIKSPPSLLLHVASSPSFTPLLAASSRVSLLSWSKFL